ncbi:MULTISPECIES: DUF3263 domain-containing protein [Cellulomonas]|uniref:DUF3263 domain-containing protein n=1 Tax=Cellulomonas TaxID=1707 RepID=UPI00165722D3|nr:MULTISPECIES: DUF3263 domain-containing protein [Cellulomonas]
MDATASSATATLDETRPADPRPADGAALSERDQAVLAFERQWWKYAGAKEQAIRELFDMSATRYYQLLNALIDDPAALAHDPMLVKRLRRMRSSRQRARTARRLGADG